MKKLILLVLIVVTLGGCSEGAKERPEEISQDVWDAAIQYTLMIDMRDAETGENILSLSEQAALSGKLSAMRESSKLSSEEKEIIGYVDDLAMQKLCQELDGKDCASRRSYKETMKIISTTFGNEALHPKNFRVDSLVKLRQETAENQGSGEETESLTKVEKYMKSNNISLTAKDVQFDMVNNLDKNFVLAGTAELDDYYNYGFDSDMEADYFCVRVTPEDGSYSDRWYLYFHRDSFNALFEKLKQGNVNVITTAVIPEFRFEKNQGLMAQVVRVEYY
ncbi:hypothetical protein DFQ01_109123 [Paenibacillus cellulosilyticus]|uniref:Lipoprotein n=1 Tax=Paenibacillus cellulosilyticus TaxID=375489 RepID=A0A2V2YT70_9BACL|nr:hypothetical protein [Paenibacillus cellulosilyticus]PWW02498.1 hypothetical protein DFQ01_109123 [Paenibacillus cellulosilyticus]QKS47200.1 hypothetical protein HUB94_22430 [Paenibacillus cellulosilyticus]